MNVTNLTAFGRYRVAQSLYTNGMNLAQNLRTLQMHDKAHDLEVWVLELRKQLMEQTDKVSKSAGESK